MIDSDSLGMAVAMSYLCQGRCLLDRVLLICETATDTLSQSMFGGNLKLPFACLLLLWTTKPMCGEGIHQMGEIWGAESRPGK